MEKGRENFVNKINLPKIEQEKLQIALKSNPELVGCLERASRFSEISPFINKNITGENNIELQEKWEKISEKFINTLFKKTEKLNKIIENGRFGENYLVKEDEVKIYESIKDISSWLDRFVSFYAYKSKILPNESVNENFGLINFDSNEISLEYVKKNKEWYKKLDFFVEQYFKFFSNNSEESKTERAIHFMDFAEYFIKKDNENYHQNWLFLRNNLKVDFNISQKNRGEGEKRIDDNNILRIRKFTPNYIEESTRESITLWNYCNQRNLKYARILPNKFYIQTKIINYSDPIPRLSQEAENIYVKIKQFLINSSFRNSKNEFLIIKSLNFDSGEMEIEHNGKIITRNYYEALDTSVPLKNHISSLISKITEI